MHGARLCRWHYLQWRVLAILTKAPAREFAFAPGAAINLRRMIKQACGCSTVRGGGGVTGRDLFSVMMNCADGFDDEAHTRAQCRCVWVVAAASTLHPSAARRERARTLSTPPPRTVEQPQACSISRSFMSAPSQTTFSAGVHNRRGKHSPPECRRQVASTHLESASASHRGAAASLLHQSELHGG